jgi:DNA-binding protein H-NS
MSTFKELQDQLADLTKKVEEAKKNEYGTAVKDIVAKIKLFNIPIEEIKVALSGTPQQARRGRPPKSESSLAVKPAKKDKKHPKPVTPKYRGPEGDSQLWTGRGRPPAWVEKAKKEGASLESFLINKESDTTLISPTST